MKTKYTMIEDMQKKLDVMADSKGVLRAGLIWDIAHALNELQKSLKDEDERHNEAISRLEQAAGIEKINIQCEEAE